MIFNNMNTYSGMINTSNKGYLEIVIGPMFSGKTSRLVEIYKQCKLCDISVVTINHSIDNRYDDELLSTHDKIKIPCIKTDKLMDLWSENSNFDEQTTIEYTENINYKLKVKVSDIILINEGQFFSDLEQFVKLLLNDNKKVFICGLDGDFERKKFGKILDLIPLCDKITKLTSLCLMCKDGCPGIFSKRITNETEQTVVGYENYIPVCRSCYDK